MKSLLMTLIIFAASSSMACLTIPKKIAFKNKPFWFDHMTVTGGALTFPSANGNQKLTINCAHKDGKSVWNISTTKGKLEDEPELKDIKIPEDYVINDSNDKNTVFEKFSDGGKTATAEVTNLVNDKNKKMKLTCSNDDRVARMKVELLVDGEVKGSIEAEQMLRARGGTPPAADATVDFDNLSGESLQFAGCGGFQKQEQNNDSSDGNTTTW